MTNNRLKYKICKQIIQLKIKKNNNPITKMNRRPEKTFSQGTHTDSQQAHEKILNITYC